MIVTHGVMVEYNGLLCLWIYGQCLYGGYGLWIISFTTLTNLLRRPVDLSTHWTVTAMSLQVTTAVGVCH